MDERIKKDIYTMECYSVIKRNTFESVLMRWMNLEPIIQSEVSQKEKDKYRIRSPIHSLLRQPLAGLLGLSVLCFPFAAATAKSLQSYPTL